MKIKSNQLIIALVILAGWLTILVIGPDLLDGKAPESLDSSVSQSVSIPLLLAPIFLLAVVAVLGWRREIGLKETGSARSLLIAWFPLLFILAFFGFALASGLSLTAATTFVLINTILVGISEELMFRGVLLYGALTQFRVWTAVFFTNIIFGSVHILNGFTTGDFTSAAIQSLSAGMAGFWFTAIRLRTKSLFPAMILHALWDCGLILTTLTGKQISPEISDPSNTAFSAMSVISPVLFNLPLFLYALWLMRGIGKEPNEEILG